MDTLKLLPRPRYKKVMVAVPTLMHAMTDGIAQFAWELGKANGRGIEFDFRTKSGSSIVAFTVEWQRNKIVADFLKTDCEALWFVDSDVIPTENSFELLRVDAPIAGGIYPIPGYNMKNDIPLIWSFYNKIDTGVFDYQPIPLPEDGPTLVACEGLGTGCMIIERKVLEDARLRLGPDEEGVPAIFRTKRSLAGKCEGTDDLDFCYRATELGYKMIAHTGLRWDHIKTVECKKQFEALQDAVAFGVVMAEKGFKDVAA